MSRRHNQVRKSELARALAGGGTVAGWAKEKQVAESTAYKWARSPKVVDEIEAIRRAVLDQAIGRLSGKANCAAEQITRLAEAAVSEAVRLQASRAVLAELMTVSSFAALERRLVEVETRLQDSVQSPAGDSRHDPAGVYRRATDDWQSGEEVAPCPAP